MKTNPRPVRTSVLIAIALAAFAFRLGIRMAFGEDYFWKNSYSAYYDLAQNFHAGKGLCFDTTCAWWPPLYPLFLALTTLGGKHYLLIVVPQALMGAATAYLAFLIGKEIFTPQVGLVAFAVTAAYPYYLVHDTALQETGMLTFWTAMSVFLLLRASKTNWDGPPGRQPTSRSASEGQKVPERSAWFIAGLSLAAMLLTRASSAPFALFALIWAAWLSPRKALLTALGLVLAVGPWLIRTYRVTGAPVLSSQTGRALWIANNADTFSHYPRESIDLSTGKAYESLSPEDNAELERLSRNEIQQSNWYTARALAYIRSHPWLTLRSAFRKLGAGFSWQFNPNREPLVEAVYFVSYVPVAILGMAGMIAAWPRREVVLIGLVFLSFICVTAVFWAHTSHRSYLDIYWIVFAASVVARGHGLRFSGVR